MRKLHAATWFLVVLTSCTVGEDEATDAVPGASVSTIDRGLSGCHGKASSEVPGDARYVLTTFGGPGDAQPMSCGGFAAGKTWYAASRQRYGCGAKLRLEANGGCVVAEALDYGPDVCVEKAAGMPIMDVSPLVSRALFGTSAAGWSDRLVVTVTEVPASTPVGECVATPPPGGEQPTTCFSATLDREVDAGTCVQAAGDGAWYACEDGAWIGRASSAGCAAAFGFCDSATLGRAVPARTCVQAASDGAWYQCNGQRWVTPVDEAARRGPIGDCATWNPL